MSAGQDYTVKVDGRIAGKRCARGSIVSLTAAEAKYENVSLIKDEGPKGKLTGSPDDPSAKSTGLTDKAKGEETGRSRNRK